MKKKFLVVLATLFCVGLTGCASSAPVSGAVLPDEITVKLGDTKESVVEALGDGDGIGQLGGTIYGTSESEEHEDLEIYYRGDVVCGMDVQRKGAAVYGVNIGDSQKDAKGKISGEPTSSNSGDSYVIQRNDNSVVFLSAEEWRAQREKSTDDELKQYVGVDIFYSDAGTVERVCIWDMLFATKLK